MRVLTFFLYVSCFVEVYLRVLKHIHGYNIIFKGMSLYIAVTEYKLNSEIS